jgi:hypothetical protein
MFDVRCLMFDVGFESLAVAQFTCRGGHPLQLISEVFTTENAKAAEATKPSMHL